MRRMFFPVFILVPFLFLVSINVTRAQTWKPRSTSQKIPVYRSKGDSMQLAKLDSAIRYVNSLPKFDRRKNDSLQQLRLALSQQAIVATRMIYFPNPDYFPLDSVNPLVRQDEVLSLTVSGNHTKLPKAILAYQNLARLEFVNTRIRRIPKKLRQLEHLEVLELYNNRPRRRLHLAKNDNIREIIIHGESQRFLPKNFRPVRNLEKADLAQNYLTTFPSGLNKNRKLRELSLQENKISKIDGVKKHETLERLSLQHNLIERVPAAIEGFPKLKRLTFNYNLITDVDPAITSLKHIEYLSFYNNRLATIPAPLYRLGSLKIIDLFYNEIESIDTTLAEWEKLEILYLAHNKIVFLPYNLDALVSLTHLYLDHNRIDHLPASVGNIKGLQVIKVNHNYLKEIPLSILSLNIEELDISNNYITDIDPGIFNYANIRILSLANNPWSANTRSFLMKKVEALRARDVFVHVMGELDPK